MDIEGAELETIDGMNELLSKGKPSLAIASYHVRDGEKTCYKVEEKLKKFGYHVKTAYPSHLITYVRLSFLFLWSSFSPNLAFYQS